MARSGLIPSTASASAALIERSLPHATQASRERAHRRRRGRRACRCRQGKAGTALSRAAGANIVSSSHLVSVRSPELSEFEFGLNTAYNAYSRWVVRCMGAAGVRDLTFLDVLVLHHVNHRGRPKRLADICFVLNVEDTHLVTYALKKLQGLGLVSGERVARRPLIRPPRPAPRPARATARSANNA